MCEAVETTIDASREYMRLDGELGQSSTESFASPLTVSPKTLLCYVPLKAVFVFFDIWPQAGVGDALWTVFVGLSYVGSIAVELYWWCA